MRAAPVAWVVRRVAARGVTLHTGAAAACAQLPPPSLSESSEQREKEFVVRADMPGAKKVGGASRGGASRGRASRVVRWCEVPAQLPSPVPACMPPAAMPRPNPNPTQLPPLQFRHPSHLQSEIHVEVHDGNVLRFGHVPGSGAGRQCSMHAPCGAADLANQAQNYAERQKEDEEEQGIYHRAERVRGGCWAAWQRLARQRGKRHCAALPQAIHPHARLQVTTFRNRNLRMPDKWVLSPVPLACLRAAHRAPGHGAPRTSPGTPNHAPAPAPSCPALQCRHDRGAAGQIRGRGASRIPN